MKKIGNVGILVLVLVSLLTGCAPEKQEVVVAESAVDRFAGMKGNVVIVTDNQTGCKYIRETVNENMNSQSVSLSVLMKADGTPDCTGKTFN